MSTDRETEMTKLDEFNESDLFDELCRERWRKFKKRLTKEERAEMAEIDARGLAKLVDGRPTARQGKARRGGAWLGEARQGDDVPHGTQGLIDGIERR